VVEWWPWKPFSSSLLFARHDQKPDYEHDNENEYDWGGGEAIREIKALAAFLRWQLATL
jgi:hypothetical protein